MGFEWAWKPKNLLWRILIFPPKKLILFAIWKTIFKSKKKALVSKIVLNKTFCHFYNQFVVKFLLWLSCFYQKNHCLKFILFKKKNWKFAAKIFAL